VHGHIGIIGRWNVFCARSIAVQGSSMNRNEEKEEKGRKFKETK
jgi:hypothetical protein